MSDAIRVLVVDDHAVVRRGIVGLLETEPDMVVAAEASDGIGAIAEARSSHPDVIVLDLVMPNATGVDVIEQLRQELPDAAILVLTSFATDDLVFPALRAGALGYVLKDCSPEDLVTAIRRSAQGVPTLHPTITRQVLGTLKRGEGDPRESLTKRETDILRLVATGASNATIARQLAVSQATVRTHMSSIFAKLHVESRTQAALYAIREGVAPMPSRSAVSYDTQTEGRKT